MFIVRNNLKILRQNKKLTQREIAKRVNITLTNYVYIEQGKSQPRIKTALLIAQALGEPIDKIFSIKPNTDERKRN